jgi:hypothetical protein
MKVAILGTRGIRASYEKLLRDVLDARRPGRLPPELIDADAVAA